MRRGRPGLEPALDPLLSPSRDWIPRFALCIYTSPRSPQSADGLFLSVCFGHLYTTASRHPLGCPLHTAPVLGLHGGTSRLLLCRHVALSATCLLGGGAHGPVSLGGHADALWPVVPRAEAARCSCGMPAPGEDRVLPAEATRAAVLSAPVLPQDWPPPPRLLAWLLQAPSGDHGLLQRSHHKAFANPCPACSGAQAALQEFTVLPPPPPFLLPPPPPFLPPPSLFPPPPLSH